MDRLETSQKSASSRTKRCREGEAAQVAAAKTASEKTWNRIESLSFSHAVMTPRMIRRYCRIDPKSEQMLGGHTKTAMTPGLVSASL